MRVRWRADQRETGEVLPLDYWAGYSQRTAQE